ncbi:hypothetical protein D9M72_515450 [compost metagenome]
MQGFLDPGDGPPLPQRQRRILFGLFKRKPEHGALLRLSPDDQLREYEHDGVQPGGGIVRGVRRQEGRSRGLRMRGGQQLTLARKIPVGGAPGDACGSSGVIHCGSVAGSHCLPGSRHQCVERPLLLARSPASLIGG